MNHTQKMSDMRILIVNDDGIGSSGIKALEKIALTLTKDVWVVAPNGNRSGKGHSVTFDFPLRVSQIGQKKFITTGTPVDCVVVGVKSILADRPPDLILSGINYGGNFADFIILSGTVNAAFAGIELGIKSIAVSQEFDSDGNIKYDMPEKYLPSMIEKLMDFKWADHTVMNVNFPDGNVEDIKGVKIAKQGRINIDWRIVAKSDPVNDPYYWMHAVHENADLDKDCELTILKERNAITITPLRPNYTNFEEMDRLNELF